MRMRLWVRQFMLRIRPMKAVVTIGYTHYVLEPDQALQLAGILMSAELYESKYHGGDKGSTYHVYDQEGKGVTIEMMPENKYQMCKMAGKPTKGE